MKLQNKTSWSVDFVESLADDIANTFPNFESVDPQWIFSTCEGYHVFNTKITLKEPNSLTFVFKDMVEMSHAALDYSQDCEDLINDLFDSVRFELL